MKNGLNTDSEEMPSANYVQMVNEDALSKIIYDKAMATSANPFAVASLKMLQANYTPEQIIENLIDIGDEYYKKFVKLMEAFPAQHFNHEILK